MDEDEAERSEDAFDAWMEAFIEACPGDQVLNRQRSYLRHTPKPVSLTVRQWINRLQTINSLNRVRIDKRSRPDRIKDVDSWVNY